MRESATAALAPGADRQGRNDAQRQGHAQGDARAVAGRGIDFDCSADALDVGKRIGGLGHRGVGNLTRATRVDGSGWLVSGSGVKHAVGWSIFGVFLGLASARAEA